MAILLSKKRCESRGPSLLDDARPVPRSAPLRATGFDRQAAVLRFLVGRDVARKAQTACETRAGLRGRRCSSPTGCWGHRRAGGASPSERGKWPVGRAPERRPGHRRRRRPAATHEMQLRVGRVVDRHPPDHVRASDRCDGGEPAGRRRSAAEPERTSRSAGTASAQWCDHETARRAGRRACTVRSRRSSPRRPAGTARLMPRPRPRRPCTATRSRRSSSAAGGPGRRASSGWRHSQCVPRGRVKEVAARERARVTRDDDMRSASEPRTPVPIRRQRGAPESSRYSANMAGVSFRATATPMPAPFQRELSGGSGRRASAPISRSTCA